MQQQTGTLTSPDTDLVIGGFADLGWQQLRLAPVSEPDPALPPVGTRFAFAHPDHGVALVDLAPDLATDPKGGLRRRLQSDGTGGSAPPILHLALTSRDLWRLSMVLDSALAAAGQADLPADPPAEGWIDRVQQALLAVPDKPPLAPPAAAVRPRPVPPAPILRPAARLIVTPAAPAPRQRQGSRMLVAAALGLLAVGATALGLFGLTPPMTIADATLPQAPDPSQPALPPPQPSPSPATRPPEAPANQAAAPVPPPGLATAPSVQAALPLPPPAPPPLPPASPEPAAVAEVAPTASGPGPLRVVTHFRPGSRQAAARLTSRALPEGTVELRQVAATPDSAIVRYFAPADRGAATQLASRLGSSWAVQDFTHYVPRPSAGTLEVWLPRALAGG